MFLRFLILNKIEKKEKKQMRKEWQYDQIYYEVKEAVGERVERIIVRILIILTVIYGIIIAGLLYKGHQVSKAADEYLERSRIRRLEEAKEEKLSVEERFWRDIRNMEVPEELLQGPTTKNVEYVPTEEEKQFAYLVAFAEAGVESDLGQTLVINVAINNMQKQGYSNLIEEFTTEGRYSSVINGEVYNCGELVSIDDVPQNVKEAVDKAFEYDYSEEMLMQQAESLGITDPKYWENGAIYFYNPEYCSDSQNELRENVKVKFQYGNHVFYRYWDE